MNASVLHPIGKTIEIIRKIPETTEPNIVRHRGTDKKQRNFPPHTLKNLPQFRDKPHEEVRQYILEKKGVDIGGNVNAFHVAIIVIFALVAITSPLWVKKLADGITKEKSEAIRPILFHFYCLQKT